MDFRSLYVHFPFCESKCHYCDFYSLGRERTRAGDADAFEAALAREAELAAARLAPRLDTIFFGGGTPSMTPPAAMERALGRLLRGRAGPETEWTMEANPSSVDRARLAEYRAFGVNRISMGVQALKPELLEKLGRVHSREQALRALEAIFAAGYTNVSVDLLCGVPGQSLEEVAGAIAALTAFPITHLSCYLLTLPPHHRMFQELPDEETQLQHLLLIDRELRARGFEHYEISNFARGGRRARHNLAYWQGAPYLGLGPSAHSFDGRKRWKNYSSLHRWGAELARGGSPLEWSEELSPEQQRLEGWMLALRLSEGFPEGWLDTEAKRARAAQLAHGGLLEEHPDRPGFQRLTARGFALSDQVVASLA